MVTVETCMRVFLRSGLFGLILSLAGCASMSMPNLKFWEPDYEFLPGPVAVEELRRALVCDTPSADSRVQVFDSAEALRASSVGQKLQAPSLDLGPEPASYVVVEQGERRTGGYSLELRPQASLNEEGVVTLQADYLEPLPDRMRIQIVTSLCVLVELPNEPYTGVVLVDGDGQTRATWTRNPE